MTETDISALLSHFLVYLTMFSLLHLPFNDWMLYDHKGKPPSFGFEYISYHAYIVSNQYRLVSYIHTVIYTTQFEYDIIITKDFYDDGIIYGEKYVFFYYGT